jgi:hypothetical protein
MEGTQQPKRQMSEGLLNAIRKSPGCYTWHTLYTKYYLPDWLIERNFDLIQKQHNSTSVVDHFSIFYHQKISEEVIRRIVNNYVLEDSDWWCISIFQDLSQDFISEFYEYLNFYNLLEHQNLSEEFLVSNIDKIHIRSLFYLNRNKKIPQELKDKIIAMRELME